MKKILMDTNFLMIPGQFKVDIFDELDNLCNFRYKLYVLDKTLDELRKLAELKGRDRACARIALDFVKVLKFVVLDTSYYEEKHPDDIIVKIADKDSWIVATQDKFLKHRLRKKEVSIITLRQKKYLKLMD